MQVVITLQDVGTREGLLVIVSVQPPAEDLDLVVVRSAAEPRHDGLESRKLHPTFRRTLPPRFPVASAETFPRRARRTNFSSTSTHAQAALRLAGASTRVHGST